MAAEIGQEDNKNRKKLKLHCRFTGIKSQVMSEFYKMQTKYTLNSFDMLVKSILGFHHAMHDAVNLGGCQPKHHLCIYMLYWSEQMVWRPTHTMNIWFTLVTVLKPKTKNRLNHHACSLTPAAYALVQLHFVLVTYVSACDLI